MKGKENEKHTPAQSALQNQNRRLHLLNEAATKLLTAEDPERAMAGIYERIAGYFQTSGFFEFEVNEPGDELTLKSCVALDEPVEECRITHLKMGEGIIGRVAEQRRAIVLEQVERSDDPNTKFLKALRIRAYACYPLLAGEHLLGTLSFASRQRENFAPEDVEFFQTVASYLALAKERLRLRDELQRHAANLEQTVRERTCKLRDLVAELEHMSYSIVHDLRAPLRAIEGFTTIILRNDGERLSPASRGLIERMLTATNRMDLLISDVLNYNKAVREELPLHPVDVGKLLREMLSSYPEFQPPRVEMSLEGEFPPILGNEAGLGQCFSNVLNNAVKFVKPGMKPCVRVWAEVKGPPDVVRVWVEDCGTGIPKEGHKRIFDMFQRMHGSDYEGTGIGLALVRKVMDRMGGRVGVESEPGKGSRFWLELNRAPERPYPPAPNGSVSSLGGDEHVQNQKAA